MNPLTQFKTTILPLFIATLLGCFGLSPMARAVSPAPDGGYPGQNTAEGEDTLFSLTTGTGNRAIGFNALYSNTGGGGNTATSDYALPGVASGTAAPDDPPTVIATIPVGEPVGAGTLAAAVNPLTNTIYVTNPGVIGSSPGQPIVCDSYHVSVIDGSTNTVLSPITVGLNPFGLAVNTKTNMVYVANTGGAGDFFGCSTEPSYTVSVIDGASNNVVNTVTVGLGPAGVAVNPKTNKVYVTVNGGCCTSGNTVAVIDGSTNVVVNTITVADDPFLIAANPRTNLIYVTHTGVDRITVIDGATDTVKATFSIGSEAREIAFDSNGHFLYVAARNINQLAVVNASNNTVVQYIPVGRRPHGVVFNPDNSRIYVTNRNDGTVSVIDSSTRTVVATVPVGGFPRFLDLNRRTGLIYVPSATDISVSVIQDEE